MLQLPHIDMVGGFKLGILLEFCIEYTVSFEIWSVFVNAFLFKATDFHHSASFCPICALVDAPNPHFLHYGPGTHRVCCIAPSFYTSFVKGNLWLNSTKSLWVSGGGGCFNVSLSCV